MGFEPAIKNYGVFFVSLNILCGLGILQSLCAPDTSACSLRHKTHTSTKSFGVMTKCVCCTLIPLFHQNGAGSCSAVGTQLMKNVYQSVCLFKQNLEVLVWMSLTGRGSTCH